MVVATLRQDVVILLEIVVVISGRTRSNNHRNGVFSNLDLVGSSLHGPGLEFWLLLSLGSGCCVVATRTGNPPGSCSSSGMTRSNSHRNGVFSNLGFVSSSLHG